MKDKKRKLVQKVEVLDVRHIENSDSLDLVTVLGWNVVCNKSMEIKIGDIVVYFAIDSFLPIEDRFEFLRSSSLKTDSTGKEGFRLRTVKLRGQISQGLIMTLNEFNEEIKNAPMYEDISELLGVSIFEPRVDMSDFGTIRDIFHPNISKTDELRVQERPDLLNALRDVSKKYGFYETEKIDGMSVTLSVEKDSLGVRSINLYTRTAQIDITKPSKIHDYFVKSGVLSDVINYVDNYGNIFIQGELYGEGILKNKLGIKGWDFKVFNIGNPSTGEIYSYRDWKDIFNRFKVVKTVKVIREGNELTDTMEELIERANNLKYDNGKPAEGIVIRPKVESSILNERVSVKVISNKYLLKNDD